MLATGLQWFVYITFMTVIDIGNWGCERTWWEGGFVGFILVGRPGVFFLGGGSNMQYLPVFSGQHEAWRFCSHSCSCFCSFISSVTLICKTFRNAEMLIGHGRRTPSRLGTSFPTMKYAGWVLNTPSHYISLSKLFRNDPPQPAVSAFVLGFGTLVAIIASMIKYDNYYRLPTAIYVCGFLSTEDGSLVQMPPWANPYLIVAATMSIGTWVWITRGWVCWARPCCWWRWWRRRLSFHN